MSSERERVGRQPQGDDLHPGTLARHRGGYVDFIRRLRRRAARQAAQGRAGIREDAPYLLRWIADQRTLRVAWDYLVAHGGPAPGLDELRFCDIPDSRLWRELRDLRDQIREGVYEPAEDRIIEISKGPGRGTRSLSIPCIHDRVVQRAVVEVLQPRLDPLFTPASYGYRPRRGVLHALAQARHFAQSAGRSVWVTADLRDAFGRVPLARLLDIVRHYVIADDVVKFIGRVLGSARQPGLRQGGPCSPLFLNLYLHHHLDRPWQRLHPDIPLLRYADDILLLCRTVAEAQQAHDDLATLIRPAGMLVKGDRRSDVVTLNPNRPAHWLGFQIQKQGRKNLRVLIAEKAWDALPENLDLAHEAPNAPAHAYETIRGWVQDKGPCFMHTDLDAAWDRIATIATSLSFDEIPSRQQVKDWWQRAYARWCRLRRAVRTPAVDATATGARRAESSQP